MVQEKKAWEKRTCYVIALTFQLKMSVLILKLRNWFICKLSFMDFGRSNFLNKFQVLCAGVVSQ